MGYSLEAVENPREELRRIAKEQLDQAIESATNRAMNRDEAVHDIRKCMKKVRAVLRMVRGELGEKVYKSENACFRDAAKSLAELRETAVLVGTVERLESQFTEQLAPGLFDTLLRNLRGQKTAVRERDLGKKNALDEVAVVLRDARKRVKDWPLKSKDFLLMAPGIRRVYKRGRKEFQTVTNAPSDENVHEWRKQVKYLWYHMRILDEVWPVVMGALIGELDALSDRLGEDHDLADLRAVLAKKPELAGDLATHQTIVALLECRQAELRSAAYALGQRIYAEKPAAFTARLGMYWSASQSAAGV